jgi:hypothetical protein
MLRGYSRIIFTIASYPPLSGFFIGQMNKYLSIACYMVLCHPLDVR